MATKEVICMRRLLNNIGFTQVNPTPLFSDYQAAIWLIHHGEFGKRTKHIYVIYRAVTEKQSLGEILTTYIPTDQQKADILTKALPFPHFSILRRNSLLSMPP